MASDSTETAPAANSRFPIFSYAVLFDSFHPWPSPCLDCRRVTYLLREVDQNSPACVVFCGHAHLKVTKALHESCVQPQVSARCVEKMVEPPRPRPRPRPPAPATEPPRVHPPDQGPDRGHATTGPGARRSGSPGHVSPGSRRGAQDRSSDSGEVRVGQHPVAGRGTDGGRRPCRGRCWWVRSRTSAPDCCVVRMK
jgi:hypothetical protein